jgi:hypothetical protein
MKTFSRHIGVFVAGLIAPVVALILLSGFEEHIPDGAGTKALDIMSASGLIGIVCVMLGAMFDARRKHKADRQLSM